MKISGQEFHHHTDVQIRISDIDILGHVNNAIYEFYYDFARLRYFEKVLQEPINWSDQALVVAHLSSDFLKPIYLDDKITVYSRTTRLGTKSLEMEQYIMNKENGDILSSNQTIMVAYSSREKVSIELPDGWRRRIREFEECEGL